MSASRVPLFERLPEIYRTRDAEQTPANVLRAWLGAIEGAFGAVHADIGQLYENLFIDTCEDWVIPYLADLLGTSHLKGDPRTLRADVADTIALRRRKGTLAAIERLAADLTGWACHCVELRHNLGWAQHLNHQRPAGGGTLPIRDPRSLALLGTPFDPFAWFPDTCAAANDVRRVNLPNLAIFLWRLAAYQLPLVQPLLKDVGATGATKEGQARYALRFDLHPLDRPVKLFNAGRGIGASLTSADAIPGPILAARLMGASAADYVAVDYFDDSEEVPVGFDLGDAGLHLFFPASLEPLVDWKWAFRGDNLCAWETGLRQPLRNGEVAIDPVLGRIVIGVDTEAQRDKLAVDAWFASFSYGAAGPVGAHPVARERPVDDSESKLIPVGSRSGDMGLQEALNGVEAATENWIVEIRDSFVHELDLQDLRLAHSLTIRAPVGQRPIVRLARPLAFRPAIVAAEDSEVPIVRLEGLYLAPHATSFPEGEALISQAALSALEIVGCTLDPGGHSLRDGSRAPMQAALALHNGYGLDSDEQRDFVPTPRILVQRSVLGAIAIDDRYVLTVESSIVDAGEGVSSSIDTRAIGPASSAPNAWGAPFDFDGITCFGAVHVQSVGGSGGLFTRRFAVLDNQHGCIRASWFGGRANRLPPNHSCLAAGEARLLFTSERHSEPGYAQVAATSDVRIRTLGPDDDTMGAFGFQLDAHKWTNLQVRLRELMPVGVRPLVVTVT
jgi:hypothetical protein